jgi:hypothetical protein
MLGAMYTAIMFFGINNCSTVLPYVSADRTVLYRERFAGTYSAWAYSLAQVRSLMKTGLIHFLSILSRNTGFKFQFTNQSCICYFR